MVEFLQREVCLFGLNSWGYFFGGGQHMELGPGAAAPLIWLACSMQQCPDKLQNATDSRRKLNKIKFISVCFADLMGLHLEVFLFLSFSPLILRTGNA